jgi:anti-anti-sigma factor
VDEAIYYQESAEILYMRICGHITAAPCTELRNRVLVRLTKAPPVIGIHIDMSDCEYMDSTFMGLLVGFNKRFGKATGRKLVLFNITPVCFELLETLGVSTLVDFSTEPLELPPTMEKIQTSSSMNPEFILNAHENLAEISEQNKNRFETLNTVLKNQIDSSKNKK